MSDQADRIEAKMDRLIELLEAEPSKRTRRSKPTLTDEEQTKIYHDYTERFQGVVSDIDKVIAEAKSRDAWKKWGADGSYNLYFRKALNNELEWHPRKTTNLDKQPDDNDKYYRSAERAKERGLVRE